MLIVGNSRTNAHLAPAEISGRDALERLVRPSSAAILVSPPESGPDSRSASPFQTHTSSHTRSPAAAAAFAALARAAASAASSTTAMGVHSDTGGAGVNGAKSSAGAESSGESSRGTEVAAVVPSGRLPARAVVQGAGSALVFSGQPSTDRSPPTRSPLVPQVYMYMYVYIMCVYMEIYIEIERQVLR